MRQFEISFPIARSFEPRRDGNVVSWVLDRSSASAEESRMQNPQTPPQEVVRDREHERRSADPGSPGSIRFSVDVSVDMKELSGWSADRINAFFSGVAQILAAQKGGKD